MNVPDVFAGIDASDYDCSAYRRKDKQRGWVWEVVISFPRADSRMSISVAGTGPTLEVALRDIFFQVEELNLLQHYTKPARSADDDIPF